MGFLSYFRLHEGRELMAVADIFIANKKAASKRERERGEKERARARATLLSCGVDVWMLLWLWQINCIALLA